MTLAPGTRLGPYEIVTPLGAGGMGEVYRARDTRLGRDVALKVLPAAVAADPARLARFEREARTVAALSHPNIVVLHSIEEADGTRFITMELVEGQDLGALVAPGGLPLPRALDLGVALADALVAAHEHGVVHRDLKPANVMVTRSGRVKVLDFGLAKLESAEPGLDLTQALTVQAPLSTAGQVVGTVPYMAPEQVRGDAVDARSDLFSFGILLYELATGRRPFAGESSADVSSAILRDTPPPLTSVRADAPPELERIVRRCLEKQPRERYQTALDVLNDLRALRRTLEQGASASMPARPRAGETTSVAVLPFVNRSRDEEDEYFSDGLADELLNVLAKIRGLRVAARSSAFAFKGKGASVAEVGRALNVATVLEGSVRKAGPRVRISVQLVQVEDGTPLWSESYDRTLDDIFAVQDDIAQAVVKELRSALLGEAGDSGTSGEVRAEVAAAAIGRGEHPEAHRLYLLGRHLVERVNEADVAKGIEYLREAIALDPRHALAWVELSDAYHYQAGYDWAPVREGFQRSLDAARHAVEIEPRLAEGHAVLGQALASLEHDWKGSQAEIRRALELAPGSSHVLSMGSILALLLGHFEEALDLSRRAVLNDPLNVSAHLQLGRVLRATRAHEEALVVLHKALELAPQRILTHLWTAATLKEMGRFAEAVTEAEREPAPWARACALAICCHAAGRQAESDAALAELKRDMPDAAAYQIAAAHAHRGEADDVFVWLEHGLRTGDPGVVWAYADRAFEPYRADPRWKALMRQLNFDA